MFTERKCAASWAQRLFERLNRAESHRRPPGADEQRRHGDMHAIDDAGLHEAGHRDAATLDQHASITSVAKPAEDYSRIEAVWAADGNHQDVGRKRRP